MIKFFRKIRQRFISEGKTKKYILYAIGEIFLVVIGILIALQVSNWNQERINTYQEINALDNLKTELQNNIKDLKGSDTLYQNFEISTEKSLQFFKKNLSIDDLKAIDTLVQTKYTTFPLTRTTYDEMLNTGKFYNLKNKSLRTQITNLYAKAEVHFQAFNEINKQTTQLQDNPSLNRLFLLKDRLKNTPSNLKEIDTTWLQNPNSPTFLAYFKLVQSLQYNSNKVRQRMLTTQIKTCEELITAIEKELNLKH